MSVSDVGVTISLNKNQKNLAKKKKENRRAQLVSCAPAFRPTQSRETMWHDPGVVGIPDCVRTKLRYMMTSSATTTVGALFSYQFRGNSVFDPDLTGAGSQPTYFDNFANIYNSYVVLSSSLEVEFLNVNATSPVLVGFYPAYNTSVGSTALDCAAMRYAVSKTVMGTGNAVKVVLRSNMSTAQQFGIREEAVVDDDLYSAIVTTNPAAAQTWYWTLFAQTEVGTTTLNLPFRVSLVYDVKFFDPNVANLSATRRGPPAASPVNWFNGAAAAAAAVGASSTASCALPQSSAVAQSCSCCARTGEFTPK